MRGFVSGLFLDNLATWAGRSRRSPRFLEATAQLTAGNGQRSKTPSAPA
jgi:hypothetical protein